MLLELRRSSILPANSSSVRRPAPRIQRGRLRERLQRVALRQPKLRLIGSSPEHSCENASVCSSNEQGANAAQGKRSLLHRVQTRRTDHAAFRSRLGARTACRNPSSTKMKCLRQRVNLSRPRLAHQAAIGKVWNRLCAAGRLSSSNVSWCLKLTLADSVAGDRSTSKADVRRCRSAECLLSSATQRRCRPIGAGGGFL